MKRLVVLGLCCIIGISCLTACGGSPKSTPKETPVVEEEEKEFEDSFEAGIYTTEDYTMTINKSGMAEEGKLVIEYTFTNNSGEAMAPDHVWGYTLKVNQLDEALVLSRLSADLADSYEDMTDALHKEIKSGQSVDGMLVFEIPEGKENVDVTIKALSTKDNKSLGEYPISMEKLDLAPEEPETTKEPEQKKEEEEVPESERTGADDALDHTQKEQMEDKD